MMQSSNHIYNFPGNTIVATLDFGSSVFFLLLLLFFSLLGIRWSDAFLSPTRRVRDAKQHHSRPGSFPSFVAPGSINRKIRYSVRRLTCIMKNTPRGATPTDEMSVAGKILNGGLTAADTRARDTRSRPPRLCGDLCGWAPPSVWEHE